MHIDTGDRRDDEDEGSGSSDFARMLEEFESSRESQVPAIGAQVRGRIVRLGETMSFVDFGARSEGAVETMHLRNPDGTLTVGTGDTVTLFVVDNRDQVMLGPSARIDPAAALGQLQEAFRARLPVTGKVTAQNTGGLEVEVSGLRAFCPFSQIESGFCADASAYVGRTLEFLVTEIGEGGKRLVVSRRALLRREEEAKARELLASLVEGAELEGRVARIESFGAFVDLGGVDGLVHVSEISHDRTETPGAALTVGQPVRVKVLSITPRESGRPKISLSMKAILPDPWQRVDERFAAGDRVSGRVARLAEFGAFVSLAPGIDGLVHVSEIANRPVAHPRDALAVGQEIEAVVRSVDRERRRISLSMKDAMFAGPADEAPDGAGAAAGAGAGAGATAGTAPGARPAPPPAKAPLVGDVAEGRVAGIKPYGLFVDLPAYGARTRGLLPHEETGEKPRSDLARRFKVGDALQVEIIDVREDGKIRLSLTSMQKRNEAEAYRNFQQASATGGGGNTAIAEAMRRALEKKR